MLGNDVVAARQTDRDVRIARCRGESPKTAKAPKRSLAAIRAEAASRVAMRGEIDGRVLEYELDAVMVIGEREYG